jgi:hypothetical protein
MLVTALCELPDLLAGPVVGEHRLAVGVREVVGVPDLAVFVPVLPEIPAAVPSTGALASAVPDRQPGADVDPVRVVPHGQLQPGRSRVESRFLSLRRPIGALREIYETVTKRTGRNSLGLSWTNSPLYRGKTSIQGSP